MEDLILLFFILAPLFDLAVTFLLFKAWKQDKNPVLWERLVTASALWLSTSFISVLAFNRLSGLHIVDEQAVLLLLLSLVTVSIPSVNWLRMFLRNKF